MADDALLLLDVEQRVARITLNRPERRNALSPALDEKLRQTLRDLAHDEQIRLIMLTGAGTAFCAGADLQAIETPTPEDVEKHLTERLAPIVHLIRDAPQPVIAAINGPAAGAGCSLALACDIRIMADAASLAVNFSQIGFVPDMGLSYFLVREIGYARAFEHAALGKAIDSSDALRLGLANAVIPSGEFADACAERAQQLAQRPARTLALTKKVMHAARDDSLKETMDLEARLQREAADTAEHREGLRAFREKRSPNFE